MLGYIATTGGEWCWGMVEYAGEGFVKIPRDGMWYLGPRKNGYLGTFFLVCPD
jgi:hypothetical protein